MSKVVGIDLGTTYSAIAYLNEHGKPEIIPNREGEHITPSVVLFDGEMPIVGTMAKNSVGQNPYNVVQFVKRLMGDSSWKFLSEEGVEYTPEEISAIVLKRLKEDAEVMLGEEVRDAVITVPAYFNDAQRTATRDAGRIAGLNVLHIINEPTAAALAYGITKLQQPQTILVYDLGGGTFDVTIMRVSQSSIDVLATGGDKNLGGFDWDNVVMEFLNAEFQKQGGADLRDDPVTEQILREKAEIAKKTLSRNEKTNVYLSHEGTSLSITLTLEKFNMLTEGLLGRTRSLMEMVLEDAQLTSWDQVDKTLLVGGSTRMKAVAALVEQVTGKKPSIELHPDEVVALGAALRGAMVAVEKGIAPAVSIRGLPLVKVSDVTSHSLGTISVDSDHHNRRVNSIIVKKDTPLPCRKSDIFQTVADGQTSLRVEVTEGDSVDPDDVTILGESTVRLPSPYPKGAPVEIFFAYDMDQIVHVTVIDKTTNKILGEFPIERKENLKESEVTTLQRKVNSLEIN
jgi:molecular chaperone DnaK